MIDITERVVMTKGTLNNGYLYYPYDLNYNERPDQIAHRYYGDPYYAWLLYLTNDITDPYYEWYMEPYEFSKFIEKKYGSIEVAQSRTKFYRNDWVDSDTLTVSAFHALPSNLVKYWEAQYSMSGSIMSYKRREEDWIVNTNRVTTYAVANTHFINDEVCHIVFDVNNVGRGQIVFSNSTNIVLQHLSGVTTPNASVSITESSYIYSDQSKVNTNFTSATLLTTPLSATEEVYYTPVSYYDYENEKNEYFKTIRVLDSTYAKTVSIKLEGLLNE